MLKSSWFSALRLLGMLVLAASVSACGEISTVTVGATSSGGTTPTSAPVATATPLPTCASLLPGAGPIGTGTAFDDLNYPSGAVATAIVPQTSGTGLWAVSTRQVCVSGTSVSSIQSFYHSELPVNGWVVSSTFPFDGAYQEPCGDPYCWAKDHAPRYVGLEKVTNHGMVVTYQLRLLIPPAEPTCTGYPPGIGTPPADYSSFFDVDGQHIALPALTKVQGRQGFADPGGSPEHDTLFLCSAGNTTSITNFVNNDLPAHGWVLGSGPCGGKSVFVKGKVEVYLANASDPTNWQLGVTYC